MIVYKDRAYCAYMGKCLNTSCFRNMGDEELEKAVEEGWMFSISNFKTDHCGYIPKPEAMKDE